MYWMERQQAFIVLMGRDEDGSLGRVCPVGKAAMIHVVRFPGDEGIIRHVPGAVRDAEQPGDVHQLRLDGVKVLVHIVPPKGSLPEGAGSELAR